MEKREVLRWFTHYITLQYLLQYYNIKVQKTVAMMS